MTPEEIAELKRLAEAATPGPWIAYDENEGVFPPRPLWCVANDQYHNPIGNDEPCFGATLEYGSGGDAEFIAAAREAIPRLIAHVEELQARIDRALDAGGVTSQFGSTADNLIQVRRILSTPSEGGSDE